VQRLQKDILPKIESQIAELSKQDEPNDATKAITKQLKVYTRLQSCWAMLYAMSQWLQMCSGGVCCCCIADMLWLSLQTDVVSRV